MTLPPLRACWCQLIGLTPPAAQWNPADGIVCAVLAPDVWWCTESHFCKHPATCHTACGRGGCLRDTRCRGCWQHRAQQLVAWQANAVDSVQGELEDLDIASQPPESVVLRQPAVPQALQHRLPMTTGASPRNADAGPVLKAAEGCRMVCRAEDLLQPCANRTISHTAVVAGGPGSSAHSSKGMQRCQLDRHVGWLSSASACSSCGWSHKHWSSSLILYIEQHSIQATHVRPAHMVMRTLLWLMLPSLSDNKHAAAGTASPSMPAATQPPQAVDLDKVSLILDLPQQAQCQILQTLLQHSPEPDSVWRGGLSCDLAEDLVMHMPELRTKVTELVSQLLSSLADL